jgi:hypothetical protein
METIQFNAEGELKRIQTMSDKGIRITFDTQELPPAQAAALHMFVGGYSSLAIAQGSVPHVEAPVMTLDAGEKSPSVRLRNTMYVLYMSMDKSESFDEWYRSTMESIITQFKMRIPKND